MENSIYKYVSEPSNGRAQRLSGAKPSTMEMLIAKRRSSRGEDGASVTSTNAQVSVNHEALSHDRTATDTTVAAKPTPTAGHKRSGADACWIDGPWNLFVVSPRAS